MISVAVIENDPRVRQLLRRWIDNSQKYGCVCCCGTAQAAFEEFPRHRPDVILLDLEFPADCGIACLRRLKAELPASSVIVLSVHKDHERISRALRAGASGYLLKGCGREEILHAVSEVLLGGAPMTREVARRVLEVFRGRPRRFSAGSLMSERESEVLDLLADGLSNKLIAAQLGISYETVCAHLRRVYEKLHVRSRTEAVVKHLHHRTKAGPESVTLPVCNGFTGPSVLCPTGSPRGTAPRGRR